MLKDEEIKTFLGEHRIVIYFVMAVLTAGSGATYFWDSLKSLLGW